MSLIVNIVNNVAQPRSSTSCSPHIIKLSASTLPTTIVCLFTLSHFLLLAALAPLPDLKIVELLFAKETREFRYRVTVWSFSSAIISGMWNTRCTKPIPYLYYLAVYVLHTMFVYWTFWPILFCSWYLVLLVSYEGSGRFPGFYWSILPSVKVRRF